MTPNEVVVVIPSNRRVSADRLEALPPEVDVLVVADSDTPVLCDRAGARTLDLEFQRRYMGENFDLIPRGTAACRNFGFYYVWRETEYRYIITLDDDVNVRDGFLDGYAVLGRTRELPTVQDCAWFNPIGLFENAPSCFARGFPYEQRHDSSFALGRSEGRVACHMGLWDGVLDTNALDKYLFEPYRVRHDSLRVMRELTRIGQAGAPIRFPVSSMNVGFVRDLLPAMYQMPMYPRFVAEYGLWRYDDVWAGYVMQTLVDRRGDASTVGAPVVRHDKAGDLHRELAGEHYGILMSPFMYDVIDRAAETIRQGSYARMVADLAENILTIGENAPSTVRVPDLYWRYIAGTSHLLRRWAGLYLS